MNLRASSSSFSANSRSLSFSTLAVRRRRNSSYPCASVDTSSVIASTDPQKRSRFRTEDLAEYRPPGEHEGADHEADDPPHEPAKNGQEDAAALERRTQACQCATRRDRRARRSTRRCRSRRLRLHEELHGRQATEPTTNAKTRMEPDRDRRERPTPRKPVSPLPHNLPDVTIVAHSARSRNRVWCGTHHEFRLRVFEQRRLLLPRLLHVPRSGAQSSPRTWIRRRFAHD